MFSKQIVESLSLIVDSTNMNRSITILILALDRGQTILLQENLHSLKRVVSALAGSMQQVHINLRFHLLML